VTPPFSTESERLVKSAERVKDLAEVFTPRQTVNDILDLLPNDMWAVHPSPTYLEPACGDGNFLVPILERKLHRVTELYRTGRLPAGEGLEAVSFHGLEALSSIYGVDISADNIVGGSIEHPIGARDRMNITFSEWWPTVTEKKLSTASRIFKSAQWITSRNIILGNMLAFDSDGRKTNRQAMPFIQYTWRPEVLILEVSKTTLGDVTEAQLQERSDEMVLFAAQEPIFLWKGHHMSLHAVGANVAEST